LTDDIGDTALHYAAREGLFEVYEELSISTTANPNTYNSMGLNAFHAACETDQSAFVERYVCTDATLSPFVA